MRNLDWYQELAIRETPDAELVPQEVLDSTLRLFAAIEQWFRAHAKDMRKRADVPDLSLNVLVMPSATFRDQMLVQVAQVQGGYVACLPFTLIAFFSSIIPVALESKWETNRVDDIVGPMERISFVLGKYFVVAAHDNKAGHWDPGEECFSASGCSHRLLSGTLNKMGMREGLLAARSRLHDLNAIRGEPELYNTAFNALAFLVIHELAHALCGHKDVEALLAGERIPLEHMSMSSQLQAALLADHIKTDGFENGMREYSDFFRRYRELEADRLAVDYLHNIVVSGSEHLELDGPSAQEGLVSGLVLVFSIILFQEGVKRGLDAELGTSPAETASITHPPADLRLALAQLRLMSRHGYDQRLIRSAWDKHATHVDRIADAADWEFLRVLGGAMPSAHCMHEGEIVHYHNMLDDYEKSLKNAVARLSNDSGAPADLA